MTRHSRILVSIAFLALAGAALARADEMSGDIKGDDHDSAYWAVKKGTVLPLVDILKKARALVGAEIVGVQYQGGTRPYYEIYYIDKAGHRREGSFDARTGKPMQEADN